MAADLSYFVYDSEYIPIPTDDYNAGKCNKDTPLELNIQIWNNRWGTYDIDNIENAVLTVEFSKYEDSSLLECCSIIINSDIYNMTIIDNVGSVPLNRALSGRKNDGNADNINNFDNFINIKILIDIKDKNVKVKDIKKMFINIKELE